jgi:arylsulfatase A-like enzyme
MIEERTPARWAKLLGLAGSGALLLGLTTPLPSALAREPASPLNVIVIKTDDQRWDTLWAMPIVQEALVSRGVTFSNAFVSTPLCCPERASFLAGGFYAHNVGVLNNEAPNGGATVFVDGDTLPVRLQRAGYRTAVFGKYLNEYFLIQPYIPPGWTKFVQTTGNRTDWTNYHATVGSSGPDAPDIGARVRVSQYLTDFLSDQVIDFIREPGASPFFVYLVPVAPHMPAIPAPEDEVLFSNYRYRGRGYKEVDLSDKPYLRDDVGRFKTVAADSAHRRQLRSLQAVDRAVGAIVEELKILGQLDRTLLVFMSDNGYLWGEHWQRAKSLPYEEAIRVPLVVVMPGVQPREEDHLVVANLDVPATIFEAAGLVREGADGRSLVPLLRDPGIAWRSGFLIEYYPLDLERAKPDPSLPEWSVWAGLRTDRYKYTEWESGHKTLFDLVEDPYELQDEFRNPAYRSVAQTLAGKLHAQRGLALISPSPHVGRVGEALAFQLAAWGGAMPYEWTVVRGDLPPGLSLDGRTGLLFGTPTRSGTFPVSIQVSDSSVSPYLGQPQTHTRPFTLIIAPSSSFFRRGPLAMPP